MRYPYLDQNCALAIITKRREGDEPFADGYLKWGGEGQEFDKTAIETLRSKLVELQKKYPGSLRERDPQGGQFEAEACSVVHESIKGDIQMLGDLDFWVFLAVVEFPDLVEWRFAGEGRYSNLKNYGIGSRPENLLYRLWMRADVAFEEESGNKYALARKGSQDFWRSHIHRQRYGNCRNLSHALLRFQYPEEEDKPRLSNDEIRTLVKRLRRLHANLEFSFLDEKAAIELIKGEETAMRLTE